MIGAVALASICAVQSPQSRTFQNRLPGRCRLLVDGGRVGYVLPGVWLKMTLIKAVDLCGAGEEHDDGESEDEGEMHGGSDGGYGGSGVAHSGHVGGEHGLKDEVMKRLQMIFFLWRCRLLPQT